jgi:hypothetical protein
LVYTNLIVKPQEDNAQKEMYMAENATFQTDSIDKALMETVQFPGVSLKSSITMVSSNSQTVPIITWACAI